MKYLVILIFIFWEIKIKLNRYSNKPQFSSQARNDSAQGHFGLVEKIVRMLFNLQFRCKHYNCLLAYMKSNKNSRPENYRDESFQIHLTYLN